MFLEDILETTLYKEQSQVQKTKKILQKFTLKKISKTRTTNLAFHCLCRPFWRRQWHPTPVLLPGKSHGWRSLDMLQSMGSLGVGHDWTTSLSLFTFMHWRRKWQPTPVFLPRESQGQGSLVGCRLWGRTELGHDWSHLAAAAAEMGKVWAKDHLTVIKKNTKNLQHYI